MMFSQGRFTCSQYFLFAESILNSRSMTTRPSPIPSSTEERKDWDFLNCCSTLFRLAVMALNDSAMILANVGVVIATLFTGYALHWAIGLPLFVALLFGAIISAT